MAKPILVIKYDAAALFPMELLDKQMDRRVTDMEMLQEMMPDYYVLIIPPDRGAVNDIEFQVFYEKDFTDIQYEELKKMIMDKLNPDQHS